MPKKGFIKHPPILGEKHGMLTLTADTNIISNGKCVVDCLCECGRTKRCRIDSLRSGITKSCGCIARKEQSGLIYGFLTAIQYIGENRNGHSLWLYKCVCGSLVEKLCAQVRSNNVTLHCGCKFTTESDASCNLLFSKYKGSAKSRGIEFALDKDTFISIVKSNCHYCGRPPLTQIKQNGYKQSYVYNGIDRVDNGLGYTMKNSCPCCPTCNVAKASYTVDYFVKWVESVHKHLLGNGTIK
jgi:hypothetical protein